MPPPNPIVARPKTSARSARLSASKLSSGFKNTLNAYSEPSGRLSAVAAAIVRHALGRTSALLTSAEYTAGSHVSHAGLPSSAPELRRPRRRDRFLRQAIPQVGESDLGRPARGRSAKRRAGAVQHGRDSARDVTADRDLALRVA